MNLGWILGFVAAGLHGLGVVSAVHAVMKARTSQAAFAWVIGLASFPYAALPLYWVFGRSRFQGYVQAHRSRNNVFRGILDEASRTLHEHVRELEGDRARFRVLQELGRMPFLERNRSRLLVDGEAAFDAMFEMIDGADHYVLVQFFIIHDDFLGRKFKEHLLAKVRQGVRVFLLYDDVGSHGLPASYLDELIEAGAQVKPFKTTRGRGNRFQINFRNHRKIVIADGTRAVVGGFNVGDEYLGNGPLGPWRDTAVAVEGPVVKEVQITFVQDWHWATDEVPELDWSFVPAEEPGQTMLAFASGPADEYESCDLFFVQAIHAARRRIWITSPYFVPGPEVRSALQLAGLRGVDVRILLPGKPDHILAWLAAYSFFGEAQIAGVRFWRHRPGFLHQKVVLIDDDAAAVGTANFDNRSFRLNFELMMVVLDRGFAAEVAEMLERDFASSDLVPKDVLAERSFWFLLKVRVAHLLAQIM